MRGSKRYEVGAEGVELGAEGGQLLGCECGGERDVLGGGRGVALEA